jgi:carboxypeptidase D
MGVFQLLLLAAASLSPAVARLLPEHLDGTYMSSNAAVPSFYQRPVPSVSSHLDRNPESYVVKSLPGLEKGAFKTAQWAGQLPIPYAGENHYGGLFFWLFEPNVTSVQEKEDMPIIIWLNGGPGCSSMDGLFIETGPFRVMPDGKVELNDLSWHNEGYLVFIDQPIGTGFSYVNRACEFCDYVHNQSAVNSHIYSAMQSLFVVFPFLKGKNVVMAGESYAGHYIPAMTDYFTTLNAEKGYAGTDHKVKVTSVAIGNGWSIPRIQYNFGSYANNVGILSAPDSKKLEKQYDQCVQQVDSGDFSSGGACNIIGQVLSSSGACPLAESESDRSNHGSGIGSKGKQSTKKPTANTTCYGPLLNYYDTRSYYVDILSSWPASADVTAAYLNSSAVTKAINIKKKYRSYTECDDAGQYLMVLYGLGVQPQIIRILEAGVAVTFYNGQYDFICNHVGTEAMLDQLPWKGRKDFMDAPGYVWTLNESVPIGKGKASLAKVRKVPAGYGRTSSDGSLTFLMVIGGSHMVPLDVPRSAYDLIRRVIKKLPFSDFPQAIEVTTVKQAHKAEAEEAAEASSVQSAGPEATVGGSYLNTGFVVGVFVVAGALVGYFAYNRWKSGGQSYQQIDETDTL